MSFFRVTTGASATPIPDLGITLAATSTVVLSNQFNVNDLYQSADLEALIIAGTLSCEIDYGTGYAAVLAADYTNRDALAAFLNVYEITNENNNEKLVNASEVNAAGPSGAPLHIHDARYFTKAQLQATGANAGSTLIGVDNTNFDFIGPVTTVQQALDAIDNLFGTSITLDSAYDNDSDGRLDVDGTGKPLDFRSNNVNDVIISRTNGTDIQDALRLDVSANELILGALLVGGLAAIDVRIKRNIIIEGDLTVTGTTTDTTVDELNVTNANIQLRSGSEAVAGADAYVEVVRGTSGANARMLWNETLDRWQAGIVGDMATIALLEKNEIVTGIWELQGSGATSPNFYMTNKAAASTTNLGSANQIPVEMVNNELVVYDKTRLKTLGVSRRYMDFVGRDNANNTNEYMRLGGAFTSNQSSARLIRNATLVGISAQTFGAETWTVRVRKNGSATNEYSFAVSAVDGAQNNGVNVDFNAGDKIEVYCDGSNVNRPVVTLEFAPRIA